MIRAKLKHLSVEEFANTITHGFGLLLSIVGFVVLVVMAGIKGGALLVISCVVYGISLIVLYAASTIYHGITSPELKRRLQVLDHCCIYLLIAGSYTPFGLVILGDGIGTSLLALIWAFAVIGVVSKIFLKNRFAAVSVVSYVLMGWLGVFAVKPLLAALGPAPVGLAVAGGIAYTLGVVFFPMHKLRHNHAIFHVFVLLGSFLHYLAVIMYVVPRG